MQRSILAVNAPSQDVDAGEATRAVRFLRIAPGAASQDCPKCAHPLQGHACAKCGLLAERAPSYVARLDTGVARELIDAWRDVRRGWHDLSRHEHVLVVAGREGAYPWLATRYREIARRGDEIAARRMAVVQRAAEMTLVIGMSRESEETAAKPYQSVRRLLLAMMAMLALGVVLMHVAIRVH